MKEIIVMIALCFALLFLAHMIDICRQRIKELEEWKYRVEDQLL